MAIITYWNNNNGRIGQSYSALAIASYMAIEHNYRMLLMSTRFKDTLLMQAFGLDKVNKATSMFTGNNQASVDLETGIESISKLSQSNRLTPDVIPTFTKMIFRDRLEVLSGPSAGDYQKIFSTCPDIINVASKTYDIVFVDLNNGVENDYTKEIINSSDIIILNAEQKLSELESLIKIKESKIIPPMKTLFLLNKYDRFSKYTIKNSTRFIGEKKDVMSVPYSNLFMESLEEGTVAEMFLNPSIRKLSSTEDKNGYFMSELKRDSEAIIYKMQELQMRV